MKKRLTTDQWINEAVRVWGAKYDYSLANFVNTKTKLTVICPSHGPWSISPDNHLRGKRGCPACGRERLKASLTKPFSSFIDEVRRVHGNIYNYDESSYAGARQKLRISCTTHGISSSRRKSIFEEVAVQNVRAETISRRNVLCLSKM